MTYSEIITIPLLYNFGTFLNFKHFCLHYVKIHLAGEFLTTVSYNRFVELESRVFFHKMFFLNLRAFGTCSASRSWTAPGYQCATTCTAMPMRSSRGWPRTAGLMD